ncbi:putative peroxygenase 3 [Tetrabaena socialis]|uniref:Putative peroxygenase 3 n=1 Tax=Tetrabaena socialis TaxID=47790 RepID=A0A2J8A1U4_9CHLO|nr:putative peroxygenase 3 [Tetrabaena socialis]|eukprot:PNH06475.1 putative peroxygenase 3 [Tetrabaena socialis]
MRGAVAVAGFRRLGFNLLISALAVPFIHLSFSYPTLKSWIPDPRLPIYLDRIHRTKHGSDSEVFDTEGRFVPEKFEEIFSKFDRDNKGGLGWKDIQEMVYANMNINDPTGWTAERLEWWVTYLLLRDHKGLVSKEKIRSLYDGTIWDVVAREVEAKKNRTSAYKTD